MYRNVPFMDMYRPLRHYFGTGARSGSTPCSLHGRGASRVRRTAAGARAPRRPRPTADSPRAVTGAVVRRFEAHGVTQPPTGSKRRACSVTESSGRVRDKREERVQPFFATPNTPLPSPGEPLFKFGSQSFRTERRRRRPLRGAGGLRSSSGCHPPHSVTTSSPAPSRRRP